MSAASLRSPLEIFFLATCLWMLGAPAPPRPRLGGAAPGWCLAPGVAVELRGLGLRCLAAGAALAGGALAGDVLPVDAQGRRAAGPPGRLPPQRWLTAQVPLDPNQASLDELQALPQVGPALARAIVAVRPLRRPADLLRVPGLGAQRARRLRPLLRFPDAAEAAAEAPARGP